MMRTRIPAKWFIGLVLIAAATADLRAQNIDALVAKKSLEAKEIADITVWVNRRAKEAASGTEKDLKKAEEELIDLVTKTKPSEAFANAFATQCAQQLGNVTGQSSEDLDQRRALAAVRILNKLDRPETAPALAGAMQSPHASARLVAAVGIVQLHKKLKDEKELETVLNALGDAGATEASSMVLEKIYRAVDFMAAAPTPNTENLMAGSLAKLFVGRATRLEQGARDEALDLIGLKTAASVVPNARSTNKKQLALSVASMMTQAVERRLDDQTNDTSRATLGQLIKAEEDLLGQLLTAAKAPVPTESVSGLLRGAKPNAKAVREALAKWQTAVKAL